MSWMSTKQLDQNIFLLRLVHGLKANCFDGGHIRGAAGGNGLQGFGPPECKELMDEFWIGKAPECLLLLLYLYMFATDIFSSGVWHGVSGYGEILTAVKVV